MIEVGVLPLNEEHVSRLLAFCAEIIAVCEELGIDPILSSSLAVFAYTRDPRMTVNDIDLSCSEEDFPRLAQALQLMGCACNVTDWHVLQVRRGDLKVEFDSREFWMRDLPGDHETLSIGSLTVRMVGPRSLTELYRRGLEGTARETDEQSVVKHHGIRQKYDALVALDGSVLE